MNGSRVVILVATAMACGSVALSSMPAAAASPGAVVVTLGPSGQWWSVSALVWWPGFRTAINDRPIKPLTRREEEWNHPGASLRIDTFEPVPEPDFR